MTMISRDDEGDLMFGGLAETERDRSQLEFPGRGFRL
jgi:hypothetical protein